MKIRLGKSGLKRLSAVVSAIMTIAMFLPLFENVNAAGGTAEIHESDITNIAAEKGENDNSFSGKLEYRFPSDFSSENSTITYDFSQVKAYAKDDNGDYQTNGESALDFSRYTMTGPIIVQGSHYNEEYKAELENYNLTGDSSALQEAGYPYWYEFDAKGVVYLDYSAAFESFTDSNGITTTDYEILAATNGAKSYVTFTCELDEEAFLEGGGEYRIVFVSDIESDNNPIVNMPAPESVNKKINVDKKCVDFDMTKGEVKYSVTVTNNGDKTISTPINLVDTLDEGIDWTETISYDSQYITSKASDSDRSKIYELNGLPSGATTTITYTCKLNSKFYCNNQSKSNTNAGNTITANTIPEGGKTPAAVELNDNGDTEIRVIPSAFTNGQKYNTMDKDGSYENNVYSWSILINSGDLRTDIAGAKLTDNNDYANGKNPSIIDSKVVITNVSNPGLSYEVTGMTIEKFKSEGITFNNSWFDANDADGVYIGASTDSYIITYKADVGEDTDKLTSTQVVINTAVLTKDSVEIGSDKKTVNGPRAYNSTTVTAEKYAEKDKVTYIENGDVTTVNIPWLIVANVPATHDSEIIFRDDLQNNNPLYFDLSLMDENDPYVFYYDENGDEVKVPAMTTYTSNADGSDSTNPNKTIILRVTASNVKKLNLSGKTLYWRVYTKTEVSSADLIKGIIYHNSGRVNNKYADAAFETTGPVSYMNKHNYSYSQDTGIATWELVINKDNVGHNLEPHNWRSIHITDNLNGMEFYGYDFPNYDTGVSTTDKNHVWTSINNQDGDFLYAEVVVNNDGTFEIIVDDSHPLVDRRGNTYTLADLVNDGERIVFRYKTYIPTSIYPTSSTGKIYNEASFEGTDDSETYCTQNPAKASVTISYPIIDKEAIGGVHDYNELDFAITVNPYALNLSTDNTGSYYVVDTLGENIDYVLNTLKVYEKKTDASNMSYVAGDKLYTLDSVKDNSVAAGTYEFSIEGKDLVIRVPDGVCVNISYTVRFNFLNSGSVSNSVYLPKTYPGSSEDVAGSDRTSGNYSVATSSAGSSPNYALFYVDKVGENNLNNLIDGVHFIAVEYDLNGLATGNKFYAVSSSTSLSASQFTADENNGTAAQKPRENYVYVLYEDPSYEVPGGYTLSSQVETFYVPSNANKVANVAAFANLGYEVQAISEGKHFLFVNEVNSLVITKIFEEEGADVSTVEFTIKGTGTTTYASTKLDRIDNTFSISNLPAGTYEITETAGAKGFERRVAPIYIEVNEDKTITVASSEGVTIKDGTNGTLDASIEVMNKKEVVPVTADISVRKVSSSDTTLSLSGAHFVLLDASGNVVDKWFSDASMDRNVKGLTVGTYTLSELTPPEGYTKCSDVKIVVDKNGDVTVTGGEASGVEVTGDAVTSATVEDGVILVVNAPEPTPEPTPEEEITPEPTPEEEITPEPTPEEEITPEPTPEEEITPEPTPEEEITPEPTPEEEITPEPTPEEEITPEVTVETTPEVTPETTITDEPTPEVTPEATPEAIITDEPTPEATPEVTPVAIITSTPTMVEGETITTTPAPTEEPVSTITDTPTATPTPTAPAVTTNNATTTVTRTGETASRATIAGIILMIIAAVIFFISKRRHHIRHV